MKKLQSILFFTSLCLLVSINAQSQSTFGVQEESAEGMKDITSKKMTITGTADASMLQLALLDIGAQSDISTLRYSYFVNGGVHANFPLSEKLTFFTGLGIKNLGLIIKGDTSTSKYRVYSAGIPLGLKIGNLNKSYLIIGGGVDFPFNYKVKRWENNRQNKTKDNEWFSDKVNPVLPYATIGYRMSNSLLAKFMYYPTNFWNSNNIIHANTNANLIVLTLGFDVNTLLKGKNSAKAASAD